MNKMYFEQSSWFDIIRLEEKVVRGLKCNPLED